MAQSTLEMLLRSRKQGTGAKDMHKELTDLKGAVGALGIGAQLTAAGGLAALAGGLKFCIGQAAEAERVNAQTEAVIRSTGGAAGVTAGQIRDMASAFSQQTAFEDEAIQSMQNVLLTFTALKGDVLPGATQAILDMNAALGGDLQGSAIQVGKALQDPILGMTALRRVGVSFSADQKAVIQSLIDTGDVAKAQALILEELNKEFGGSAAAKAKTYTGQMERLKNEIGNLGEALATTEIAGKNLIGWLGGAAEAARLLITQEKNIGDVLRGHNEEMLDTADSYEAYVDEMLRANVVAGELRESQVALVREFMLTGEGGMMAQVALEGVTVATEGAYNAARIYDDRLESIRTKGAIDTYIGADTTELEAKLAEIAEKTPGTTQYWAALEMQVDAKVENAITASRLAFLEWLRYHPEMHLTVYEQVITNTRGQGWGGGAGTKVGTKTVGGEQEAGGGPLAPVAKLGEEGFEYVFQTPNGFVVLPHGASMAMEKAGLLYGIPGMRLGGLAESGGLDYIKSSPINPDPYGGLGNIGSSPKGGMAVFGGGSLLGGDGGALLGGGGSSSSLSSAALAEVVQQAAAGAAVGVGVQIPTAVSRQAAEQNAIMARGQQELILEVRRLNDTIRRSVRDAVAQI